MNAADTKNSTAPDREPDSFDVVIVGAGFAGLYMLYSLRERGMTAKVYEAGDNVGGTWYWNRYPGARCDAESLAYSFSFSEPLEQDWAWTERYATQPEILKYAEHVADRFDLRRHIRFEHRVTAAHYDEATRQWRVETDRGDVTEARFCIMATGCLSVPLLPDIPGLDDFQGPCYQASLWPHEGVDFRGQRVAVIGTGSSGIQAIPVIAEQARQLTVFQRTANYSVPAVNGVLDPDWVEEFKTHYQGHRQNYRLGLSSGFGDLEIVPRERGPAAESAAGLSEPEFDGLLNDYWTTGGAVFMAAIADTMINPETNELVAEFVRKKIRETVHDPATAEILCPSTHPIGTKRICVDTGYYETYNRDNVSLVDVAKDPIEAITRTGLRTQAREYEFDTLVLATGFDAMTGALRRMDIRGVDGQTLTDKWQAGPRSYLGMGLAGFPNLFTITGPGSPSVLSNMLISIEQHVDWMVDCIDYMNKSGFTRFEPEVDAEDRWVQHVNEVAEATLFPQGGSWYLGANVPGKPRVFMPYAAGVGAYREICDQVRAKDFEGFLLS